jgi:hypothetical protein
MQDALNISEGDLIIKSDSSSIIDVFQEGNMDRSKVSIMANEFRMKKPPDRQVKI